MKRSVYAINSGSGGEGRRRTRYQNSTCSRSGKRSREWKRGPPILTKRFPEGKILYRERSQLQVYFCKRGDKKKKGQVQEFAASQIDVETVSVGENGGGKRHLRPEGGTRENKKKRLTAAFLVGKRLVSSGAFPRRQKRWKEGEPSKSCCRERRRGRRLVKEGRINGAVGKVIWEAQASLKRRKEARAKKLQSRP